jgi:hypothetical protein
MDSDQRPSKTTPNGVRYQCLCCGYFTLEDLHLYDICPVCFWEDDPVQKVEPSFRGDANHPSLNEARRNFQTLGAVEQRLVQFVRQPLPEEMPLEPNPPEP